MQKTTYQIESTVLSNKFRVRARNYIFFFEIQKYSVYLQMKLQIINRVHTRIIIYKQHEKLTG